ncbi:hypothetical protein [Gulosibacter sediminis]|uniref:hypothetical protein n=1 Tax=Gulosibacter sediminis TaxID=1729695 RepID=UPI0024A8EB22|nr:hypothetical protein [Gulosibacter sediminis]
MASNRRMRVTASALGALLAVSALAGCANLESFGIDSEVQPWAVANHDDKLSYHSEAGDALLNLDTTTGLAELETFQAVGYHHVESPDSSLHMEYETSVDGESYVSQLHTNVEGYSFDQSHRGGDTETYYLLGDAVKEVASEGKSWVSVPTGDLNRAQTPENVCQLFAVSYTCALIDAWNSSREQLGTVPVELSRAEDGSQHFATAVSYASLVEQGLISDSFSNYSSEETNATLIPMHLWVDETGLVTKVEVNGVITGDDASELAVQIGFELTSTRPSTEMTPVEVGDIPEDDLYEITTESQLETFLQQLAQV